MTTGTLLVTGAAGFIGRRVCSALASGNVSARAAVRRPAPDLGVPTITIGEIDGTTDWTAALDGVDTVIHLAGRAHVLQETNADPLSEFRRVNVEGTRRLAEAALRAGVSRLVFVSSIGVNGESTDGRSGFTEADAPNPQKPYAVSKLEAENALREAASGGLSWTIIRPPLVYGGDAPGNFHTLLRLVKRGLPLPLGSTGNRRTMIGVDNLADVLIHAARHPAAAHETFLVGDSESLSTPALIRALASGMGVPARLLPFPPVLAKLGASMTGRTSLYQQLFGSLVVETGSVRQQLQWTPPHTTADGLRAAARAFAGSAG